MGGIGFSEFIIPFFIVELQIFLRPTNRALDAFNNKQRGDFLAFQQYIFRPLIVIFGLMLITNTVSAQEKTAEKAEKLMIFQLEALKAKNHKKFLEHGNKAFKEFMDEYTFDSLIMQRSAKISKGYTLKYLGNIRSIGMRRHLWKVNINNDKYQLLGSLSLSHGKVVGFNLE